MTRVLKFGGSSLADAECLRAVAAIVAEALPQGPLVVLSACGDTTDDLFAAAHAARAGDLARALESMQALLARHAAVARQLFGETLPGELGRALAQETEDLTGLLRGVALLRELSPRSMDAIAAHGERLSTRLFASLLEREEFDVTWFDARGVVVTDERFGQAQPDRARVGERAKELLAPLLRPGRCVVTQGYVGATHDGVTTTLGRGGSDYSAALLGAALGVDEVQIWTDVEGVMTADPRVVEGALPIAELSFAEAAELALFGARVLHPATIQPAVEAGLPVTVRHTRRPAGRFTTITGRVASGRPVTALATRGPISVLTVISSRMLAQPGFLARLFAVFGRHAVSVDLVATAEVSVSLTVEADAPLDDLVKEIEEFARVDVANQRAIVAIVGERLKQTPGLAARIFEALGAINVEMISMGANEINLSLVVAREHADEALRRLHRTLFGR